MQRTVKELKDRYKDLVNDMVLLENELEEAWKFHPGNPDGFNPEEIYDSIMVEIKNIEKEIEEINNELNI